MSAEDLWQDFIARYPEAQGASYEAWSYGTEPDEFLALTLSGRKRATASALPLYEAEGEAIPQAGEYSVLLDSRGEAACVLVTKKVSIIPFCMVSSDFAAREGEGDLSLAYWRQVHEAYFSSVMEQAGLTFTQNTLVVCEEFEVIYR